MEEKIYRKLLTGIGKPLVIPRVNSQCPFFFLREVEYGK